MVDRCWSGLEPDEEKYGSWHIAKGPIRGTSYIIDTARIAFNKYPLIVDEVLNKEACECPKCRKECNCGVCQTRKGRPRQGELFVLPRG